MRVLVDLLVEHRKRLDEVLIFPASTRNTARGAPGGQADGHMLRRLKHVAFPRGSIAAGASVP